MDMKPNFDALLEDFLSSEASRPAHPELDALMIAKARQDLSHDKLDKWIAAAIAELSDKERAA
jgi:hypothetical protein